MKVAIIGSGAYGSALGKMFLKNTSDVIMWTAFEKEALELRSGRCAKLEGENLPLFNATTSIEQAIDGASLIVIALPAFCVEDVFKKFYHLIKSDQHLLIATKGIENESCLFIRDIILKYLDTDKIAVISGPSFAVDIVRDAPVGLSLASTNKDTIKLVKKLLEGDTFKLRETDDLIGIEICGAIKNVIAIASGIIAGMGYPESTQAMFITESLHDIKNVIKSFGGSKDSILSFAGFGDLLLTATSKKSRNFNFGFLFGSGALHMSAEEYEKKTTVEGLNTLRSMRKLLSERKEEMPIIDLIHEIIYEGKKPEALILYLINKS